MWWVGTECGRLGRGCPGRREGEEIADQTIQRSVLCPQGLPAFIQADNTRIHVRLEPRRPYCRDGSWLSVGVLIQVQRLCPSLPMTPPKPTAFPSVHLMEAAPLQGCQAAGSSTASRRMSSKRKPPGHRRPALAGSREGAGGGQAVQFRFCPSGVTQLPGTGRRRQLPAPVPDSGRRP